MQDKTVIKYENVGDCIHYYYLINDICFCLIEDQYSFTDKRNIEINKYNSLKNSMTGYFIDDKLFFNSIVDNDHFIIIDIYDIRDSIRILGLEHIKKYYNIDLLKSIKYIERKYKLETI